MEMQDIISRAVTAFDSLLKAVPVKKNPEGIIIIAE